MPEAGSHNSLMVLSNQFQCHGLEIRKFIILANINPYYAAIKQSQCLWSDSTKNFLALYSSPPKPLFFCICHMSTPLELLSRLWGWAVGKESVHLGKARSLLLAHSFWNENRASETVHALRCARRKPSALPGTLALPEAFHLLPSLCCSAEVCHNPFSHHLPPQEPLAFRCTLCRYKNERPVGLEGREAWCMSVADRHTAPLLEQFFSLTRAFPQMAGLLLFQLSGGKRKKHLFQNKKKRGT